MYRITRLVLLLYSVFLSSYTVDGQENYIHRKYEFLPYTASAFNSIIVTDSCYYISGIIADSVSPYNVGALIAKIDLDGNPLNIKTYTDKVEFFETWFQSLSIDNEGNLSTHGYNYAQDTNVLFFVKYTNDGDILEFHEFCSDPNSEKEIPYDMVKNEKDQFFLSVAVSQPNGFSTLWIIKLDPNGNQIFAKEIDTNVNTIALSRVCTTQDNGLIVGSVGSDQNVVSKNITIQLVLTKLNEDGDTVWNYLSPINEDWFGALGGIVVNQNNEIIFASGVGTAIPINSSSEYYVWDWCIVKLDSNRNQIWKTYFRPNLDSLTETDQNLWNMIELQNHQGYVAIGQTFDPGPKWFGWIVKVAENGDSLWMRKYNFEDTGVVYQLKDIKEDNEGNLIMVGEIRSLNNEENAQNSWLLKTDKYGCLVPDCHLVKSTDLEFIEPILKLYPNPTIDYLIFYCAFKASNKNMRYIITDSNGVILFESANINSETTYINSVRGFASGNYYVHLICDNQCVKSEQFVVIE